MRKLMTGQRESQLLRVAESLRPELKDMPGFVLIGVRRWKDEDPTLVVNIMLSGENKDTVTKAKESLEATGLSYVIQDVSKVDAKRRID